MTYHRARRGWGSMKKRGCDTEREWGWWGVNYLHLAGMSHRRYSRYLLSTAFHPICLLTQWGSGGGGLTFAAAGPCFLSAEQCIGSMLLVKSLELPFSLLSIWCESSPPSCFCPSSLPSLLFCLQAWSSNHAEQPSLSPDTVPGFLFQINVLFFCLLYFTCIFPTVSTPSSHGLAMNPTIIAVCLSNGFKKQLTRPVQ